MGGSFQVRIGRMLVLVSFLARLAFAADCTGDFIVSSQADANTKLGGCNTITGSIVIASNYSGPFVVSNITSITNGILMQATYEPTDLFDSGQNLTSLQADSVVTMGGGDVRLVDVPLLTSVSMSSLQSAGAINVAFNSNGSLNFPALVNLTDLHIFGVIGSMDFSNLTTVAEQLYVSGIYGPPKTDLPNDYDQFSYTSYEPYQGFDAVFPVLESAMAIGLWGNVSSIHMPKLVTAAIPSSTNQGDILFDTGIVVQTYGNNLDVNLPTLSTADAIELEGTISSVELPSLYNVSGNFLFNTTADTSINTYPLQSAGNLTLWGNLTSINTTSIQTITSTEVLGSIYGIECAASSISPAWLSNTTLALDPDRLYAYKALGAWTYICYPGIKFHRKALYPVSTGGIVGISVGIGIPLLLFIVWFVHRRGNKKIALEVEKRRQARLAGRFSGDGEDGHELQERRHREAPPVYKAEGDGVVVESASTEGGDSAMGGQRLPGYHGYYAPHVGPKKEE